MKNKLLIMLILIAMMLSLTSQVYSQEKSPAKKKITSTQQVSALSKTTGKVTSCNLKNSTVTISTSAVTALVITVDKNTLLSKVGKSIKLADIKKGDVITVSYETKRGINMAKSISVQEKTAPTVVPAKNKK